MSPIVLPRNERVAAGRWGQSGPELRAPGDARAVLDRSGPQGVAGSGDTEAGSAEGLGWEVRVPHPARPASPAGAAEAWRAGASSPKGVAGSWEGRPRG